MDWDLGTSIPSMDLESEDSQDLCHIKRISQMLMELEEDDFLESQILFDVGVHF